jgi:predicted choloylglycine hydrolase
MDKAPMLKKKEIQCNLRNSCNSSFKIITTSCINNKKKKQLLMKHTKNKKQIVKQFTMFQMRGVGWSMNENRVAQWSKEVAWNVKT